MIDQLCMCETESWGFAFHFDLMVWGFLIGGVSCNSGGREELEKGELVNFRKETSHNSKSEEGRLGSGSIQIFVTVDQVKVIT